MLLARATRIVASLSFIECVTNCGCKSMRLAQATSATCQAALQISMISQPKKTSQGSNDLRSMCRSLLKLSSKSSLNREVIKATTNPVIRDCQWKLCAKRIHTANKTIVQPILRLQLGTHATSKLPERCLTQGLLKGRNQPFAGSCCAANNIYTNFLPLDH